MRTPHTAAGRCSHATHDHRSASNPPKSTKSTKATCSMTIVSAAKRNALDDMTKDRDTRATSVPDRRGLPEKRGGRMNKSVGGEEMRVGRQTVRLTRPEKLLFPDDDIDKREVADYYARVASTMLPYLH